MFRMTGKLVVFGSLMAMSLSAMAKERTTPIYETRYMVPGGKRLYTKPASNRIATNGPKVIGFTKDHVPSDQARSIASINQVTPGVAKDINTNKGGKQRLEDVLDAKGRVIGQTRASRVPLDQPSDVTTKPGKSVWSYNYVPKHSEHGFGLIDESGSFSQVNRNMMGHTSMQSSYTEARQGADLMSRVTVLGSVKVAKAKSLKSNAVSKQSSGYQAGLVDLETGKFMSTNKDYSQGNISYNKANSTGTKASLVQVLPLRTATHIK